MTRVKGLKTGDIPRQRRGSTANVASLLPSTRSNTAALVLNTQHAHFALCLLSLQKTPTLLKTIQRRLKATSVMTCRDFNVQSFCGDQVILLLQKNTDLITKKTKAKYLLTITPQHV